MDPFPPVFEYDDIPDTDEEADEEPDAVYDDLNEAKLCGGVVLAPLNTAFKKAKDNLWQEKKGPIYNDNDAGPTKMPKGVQYLKPLQVFLMLFPQRLCEAIVAQTNLYALQVRDPEQKRAPKMTLHEFFVWMGLHMKMMRNWTGRQDSFFTDFAAFDARDHMSRARFYWIKKHLHFVDQRKRPSEGEPNWDPLFLLRPLITVVNYTFRKHWTLGTHVSLDEMMLSFRGHNPFHRYVPRKPHPNGFKLHAICDAKKFFCVAFLVDDNVKRTIADIASALFENNVVSGMTVITDRFYTCSGLVRYCLATGVGLIGSTKTNNFLAKHVLTGWSAAESKKIPRGTYEVATNHGGKICCVVWKDKGIVRFTCTATSTCRVQVKRREKFKKPSRFDAPFCAKVYDEYFHGVDRNDQLRGTGYGLALHFRAQKYTIKFLLIALQSLTVYSGSSWPFAPLVCTHATQSDNYQQSTTQPYRPNNQKKYVCVSNVYYTQDSQPACVCGLGQNAEASVHAWYAPTPSSLDETRDHPTG